MCIGSRAYKACRRYPLFRRSPQSALWSGSDAWVLLNDCNKKSIDCTREVNQLRAYQALPSTANERAVSFTMRYCAQVYTPWSRRPTNVYGSGAMDDGQQ